MNPLATCKFQMVTFGGEEAIANSWPYEQKPNTKAHQADKLAKDGLVPKGNRNLMSKLASRCSPIPGWGSLARNQQTPGGVCD